MHLLHKKDSRYQFLLIVTLVISVIILLCVIKDINPRYVNFGDYIQYWASGKLLVERENPYSWNLINSIKLSVGYINPFDDITPSMYLYPPWSLIFILPIGYMNYTISRVIWLLSNIVIIYISILLLWKIFLGSKKYQYLPIIIGFTFAPTFFVLGIGHFTTLHLLGVTLFLHFINNTKNTGKLSDLLAGFFASYITIKPNVLLLIFLSILIWSFIKKRWLIPLGMILFIIIGSVFAMIFNNQVIVQYWSVIRNYSPKLWDTPTLGMLLRHIFGLQLTWLSALPTAIGIGWLLIRLKLNLNLWDWTHEIPIITLLSIVCAPYIWTYDMVVLLIPIIYVFAKLSLVNLKTSLILILLMFYFLSIVTYILHLYFHDFWFFWIAPAYLLWFVVSIKSIAMYIQPNLSTYIINKS